MARWRDIKHKKSDENLSDNIENLTLPTSLLLRFKAFIVDSFMVTMPIMYFVVYIIMGNGEIFSQNKGFGWSIILALHALVILGFLLVKKETPGMRAYGLTLQNNNLDKPISFIQIILRYIFTILSSITLFGFIPYFRKDKKMIQDLLTGTNIVVNDKRTSK